MNDNYETCESSKYPLFAILLDPVFCQVLHQFDLISEGLTV